MVSSQDSNLRPVNRNFVALPIAQPRHDDATGSENAFSWQKRTEIYIL